MGVVPLTMTVYMPSGTALNGSCKTTPGFRVALTSVVEPSRAIVVTTTSLGSSDVASTRTAGSSSEVTAPPSESENRAISTSRTPVMTCAVFADVPGSMTSTPEGTMVRTRVCCSVATRDPPELVTCTTGMARSGARAARLNTCSVPAGTTTSFDREDAILPVSP